jgi:hypothetical protein
MRWLAIVFALLAGGLLVVRAAGTSATSSGMTVLEWAAVAACSLAAAAALAAAGALAWRSTLGQPALAVALVLAVAAEALPAGPPRLLALLPLLIAFAAARGNRSLPTVPRRLPSWQVLLGWLAFALYIPVGLLYLVSGLVVPAYGIAVLLVIWTLLLVVLLRLLVSRPAFALLVPAGAFALWVGLLAVGEAVFGWTA